MYWRRGGIRIGIVHSIGVDFAFPIEFAIRDVGYKNELPRRLTYVAVLTATMFKAPPWLM